MDDLTVEDRLGGIENAVIGLMKALARIAPEIADGRLRACRLAVQEFAAGRLDLPPDHAKHLDYEVRLLEAALGRDSS